MMGLETETELKTENCLYFKDNKCLGTKELDPCVGYDKCEKYNKGE